MIGRVSVVVALWIATGTAIAVFICLRAICVHLVNGAVRAVEVVSVNVAVAVAERSVRVPHSVCCHKPQFRQAYQGVRKRERL